MAIIPQTDVHLATEVRDVLNAAGGSVTNDTTTFFSTNAKINKWARYKPTIYPNLLFPDGTEDPLQWQAYNGLCGFKEDSILFIDRDALIAAYDNNGTYVYELPTGGEEAPLRLGDFRNYKTDARPPIWSFDYEGQMVANNGNSSSTFTILGNGDIDEYCIHMSDILADGVDMGSLANFYFGVILKDNTGAVRLTKKNANPIGSDAVFSNNSVTVAFNEINYGGAGTWYAYPALIDGDGKKFMACPIGAIEFQILVSIDANKLGWSIGSGSITLNANGRYTVAGQLAYSTSFEGVSVWIELQVNGVDMGNGEEVTLAKDSESDEGDRYFMNYSRTIIMGHEDGSIYRLRCGYGNNWLNNAYLDLGTPITQEPE